MTTNKSCECGWIHGEDDEGCKRWHDGRQQGREEAFRFMHEHINAQLAIITDDMPAFLVIHNLSRTAKDMEIRDPGCWKSFETWIKLGGSDGSSDARREEP